MKTKTLIHCGVVLALLTACSSFKGMIAQRDQNHAEFSQKYRAAVASAGPFVAKQNCHLRRKLGEWSSIAFTQLTPVVTLPNGTAGAAICVTIPIGARALEVQTDADQFMIIHPSLQFLDDRYSLLKDVPYLRLTSPDPFYGRFQLDVNTELSSDLANAAQVIVYIHPSSLTGKVDVHLGSDVYPILFTPYGRVKLKFH